MKKTLLFFLLLFVLLGCCLAQEAQETPGLTELEKLDARLMELKAQVVTLDNYSPENFPGFEDLEKTNQLVEQLEFNKRKFDLLIDQFNVLEDEIFPHLKTLYKEKPQQRNEALAKIREYGGSGEKSIITLQAQINRVSLQIERLEKKIERLQAADQKKEVAEEKKQKTDAGRDLGLSARIQKLEEEQEDYQQAIEQEQAKLAELKEEARTEEDKIVEKTAEAAALRDAAKTAADLADRRINEILARVRDIRINGLEIPRLNTTKTFIYLSKTNISTLKEQKTNLEKEINSLKKIRRSELKNRAIKGVIIIFIALLLVFGINRAARRVSRKVIEKIEESEKVTSHQKQRYQTLSSVILSFVKILSWILAVLWVLGELEVDYAPFLVAAGGISLAIGFGAQSLVKDIVSGFFILMEEQFALGDVVEIDGKTGTIENISMRTVKFRSLDGTLHIIPNGSISRVSNSTHQWSRAVIKVGVSYDADAQEVLKSLQDICSGIYEDPEWKEKLIEEPIAQGIISLDASSVMFRVLAKTKPGEQWPVERELQIRIKKTFDEQGIEIPYNYMNLVDRTPRPEKKRKK